MLIKAAVSSLDNVTCIECPRDLGCVKPSVRPPAPANRSIKLAGSSISQGNLRSDTGTVRRSEKLKRRESMDWLTPTQRSRAMRGNKGKDTCPELLVRKTIHAKGFRYRLHGRDLPGRPDIVLPKYKAVIQIDGCFWHGHDCQKQKPDTNSLFWETKLKRNRERDAANKDALLAKGWRFCRIWECSLTGKGRLPFEEWSDRLESWLKSEVRELELRGLRS